jgi:hypothetical protein
MNVWNVSRYRFVPVPSNGERMELLNVAVKIPSFSSWALTSCAVGMVPPLSLLARRLTNRNGKSSHCGVNQARDVILEPRKKLGAVMDFLLHWGII